MLEQRLFWVEVERKEATQKLSKRDWGRLGGGTERTSTVPPDEDDLRFRACDDEA